MPAGAGPGTAMSVDLNRAEFFGGPVIWIEFAFDNEISGNHNGAAKQGCRRDDPAATQLLFGFWRGAGLRICFCDMALPWFRYSVGCVKRTRKRTGILQGPVRQAYSQTHKDFARAGASARVRLTQPNCQSQLRTRFITKVLLSSSRRTNSSLVSLRMVCTTVSCFPGGVVRVGHINRLAVDLYRGIRNFLFAFLIDLNADGRSIPTKFQGRSFERSLGDIQVPMSS